MESVVQVQLRFEQILRMQDRQLVNLLTLPDINELMEMELPVERNFQLINKSRLALNNIMVYDLGIDMPVLINIKHNWQLSFSGMSEIGRIREEKEMLNFLKGIKGSLWFPDYEEKEGLVFNMSNRWLLPNTVKYILSYPLNGNVVSGYALISVPCSWYSHLLDDDISAKEIFVIDTEGGIVASKSGGAIGKKINETSYNKDYETYLNGSESNTIINYKSSYMNNISRSAYNGWSYFYITDLEETKKELALFRNIVFCLGLIITAAIIAVSYIKALYFYRPVKNLFTKLAINEKGKDSLDEFKTINDGIDSILLDRERLAESLKNQSQIGRELTVRKIINGEISDINLEEKVNVHDFPSFPNSCKVCLIQLESLEDTGYKADDKDWINLALITIINETSDGILLFPSVIDGPRIVIVLGGKCRRDDFNNEIMIFFQILSKNIKEKLNVDIAVCISSFAEDYNDISERREEANEMFKYLIRWGRKNILFAEEIEENISIYPEFPSTMEENILLAIRKGDEEETNRALELFIQSILENDKYQTSSTMTFMRLVVDLMRLFQEYNLEKNISLKKGSLFEDVMAKGNQKALFEWFKKNYTIPLLEAISYRISKKDNILVEKMKKIAETRYESYLSCEIIASELSSYPSFLRRIFKSATGITFNTYLTQCRIEAAKKLLSNTEMTIFDIARKLTYQNAQNFIRTFHLHTGLTPGGYRKILHRN
jgi:AraC-like DNA-binding protein